jgi:hypothetical protein
MELAPLTPGQQAAAAALVSSRRIEAVVGDHERADAFVTRAAAAMTDADNLTHAHTIYNVAYDACHDVGEAVLAAYGYRTVSGAGQHEAVGRFLTLVFNAPPGERAAKRFDQLRRARNSNRYEVTPVGAVQAEQAKTVALELIAAAQSLGLGQ